MCPFLNCELLHTAFSSRERLQRWISVSILLLVRQASLLVNDNNSNFEFKLCESLYDCEKAISDLLENRLSPGTTIQCAQQLIGSCETIVRMMLTSLGPLESWTWVSLIFIASILLARTYCEGQFGVTPGKWLLGIRTSLSNATSSARMSVSGR